ncbi:DUF3558 domain-containing protein [Nocardia goodfellowii]|uniref:DUF3558 domain-containing protein n=1 Tax=Nocardia goodfellowii TaxID=882446 RepID=A0ABS4QB28_9NOCA|nr:DUF3558 domain-containing protein [Nocardia goodfellowii]MBP2188899.1 hypothetical protein [Nocardia goodfellowii]
MGASGLARSAGLAAVLAAGLAVAGCGQTVPGSAYPAGGSGGAEINTNFDKLLRECEVVGVDKIGEAVGNSQLVRGSFNGAVCMWDVEDAPGGVAMVTLAWYEVGSLNNEKANNDKLGYSSENITVQGSRGLQTRRPNDPDSCGVTASAADTGVVSWWINYRPGSSHPDPCQGAKQLLELTLNRAR